MYFRIENTMASFIRFAATIAVALLGFASSAFTHAQSYPSKPIRYVVPFVPGGATDFLARLVAQQLSNSWKVPVVVENRAGAGGNIGTEMVAKAPPDGYTLLMAINSHAINASLYKKLPYDPIKDFVPVSLVAVSPNVIAVPTSLPVATLEELIKLAQAKPGTLTYGSAGPGSGAHLAGELFKSLAKVDMAHVPYKGAGQVVTDLVAGRLSTSFVVLSVIQPHAQAGKLRILAVTTKTRSPLVPSVPTVAEAGLSGFDVVSWFGTFAPAGTPADIVSALNAEIAKALQVADVRAKTEALGLELRGDSSEEFGRFVRTDWAIWDKVIKDLRIQLD